MKRESGENPELSRSCKLQHSLFTQLSLSVEDGKTEKRGVSQKTCQNIVLFIAFGDWSLNDLHYVFHLNTFLTVCCEKTHNNMNKKIFKQFVGLGFTLLAIPFLEVNAQEKSNSLDEVVVTASRSPRKQSEIGKVVRVISSQQLAQSQGRTLPELLNNVAGLTIGGNGNHPGDIKALYLRGAAAGNTLILIDGVAVNDASTISGEYDISAVSIDQIERIEILKGGNSTLYGSDAVAGVINIITKKGQDNRLKASLLATGGSYGTFKEALSLNGSVGKTRIGLNASNLNSKGFSTAASPNAVSELEKDGFDQQGISFNIQRRISERFRLNANIQANRNQADLDAGAFSDSDQEAYNKQSSLLGLGGQYILGNATLDFNWSENKVNNEFTSFGDTYDNTGKISNAEVNLTYPITAYLDLISGFNYKRSATSQFSTSQFSPDLVSSNNLKSLYSSFFIKLGKNFRTELGGRYNDHSVYGTNLTYTINPSYLIADKYKLFINFSSAYKVPSLYQLFSVYGNINLKPESTRTFEFGADMDIAEKIRLNWAYFNRTIQDVIGFGSNFTYINSDQQKDHGFELELNAKPSTKIQVDAFYAYVYGRIYKGTSVENNLLRRPMHSAGLNMSAQISSKVSSSLIYKWVGSRKDSYYDGFLNQTVNAQLSAYNLLDLYIQYQPTSKVNLFADVKNLLNVDYVDFAGYTTKRINFNLGLKVDFK